jgi:N6-L-threonylcarbamoyladenine synthase
MCYILGIESSCDDTSAAILKGTELLSNVTANQEIHRQYGGVVPELASRAHQQHIIPVIEAAIQQAKIGKKDVDAVAFTRGPGLLGSLLVGTSFAKSFALASGIPLIEVNHMNAHILAHFIQDVNNPHTVPSFPFLCLTVSGGHTQVVIVRDVGEMKVVGKTIDDAAGETFDKAAKIMGLPYPGGPVIDQLAKQGDPNRFAFPHPKVPGYDFSFSGLKTSFLYLIRDALKKDPDFIAQNQADLAASIQKTIIDILIARVKEVMRDMGCAMRDARWAMRDARCAIRDVAVAGGVSANSGLRKALLDLGKKEGWNIHIPQFQFTTDNAAMIAVAGYFKYIKKEFADQTVTPYARVPEK